MHPTWNPPENYHTRPVAVLGAGLLGRRVACVWVSAGYTVKIRDLSSEQRTAATEYIQENVASYAQNTGRNPGTVNAVEDLKEAVENAWFVIEAVPEVIALKISTFAELEKFAPRDCVLASNSSSYKSSEMIERVSDETKTRILNMHYYMPPESMIVELMTDGYTNDKIFPFVVERSKEAGSLPFVARKESTGFILNRLWAAIKREVLTILAEGVAVPEEVDSMWQVRFVKEGNSPCNMMDDVGLGIVASIEGHYIETLGLSGKQTIDFLKTQYLNHEKLGTKSPKGGLYPPPETRDGEPAGPKIYILDVGMSSANPTTQSGEILELTADGKIQQRLATNQPMPDGIAVDPATGLMFWTCMGISGKVDGTICSANLDGRQVQTIVPRGTINTPKQLTLDSSARKIYFADREGTRIYRCNFDGAQLEVVVDKNKTDPTGVGDVMTWCVGIAVAPSLGKFYWTQKGPSKGGKGRIFCASIEAPAGQLSDSRTDVECILSDLPESVDLDIDESTATLYWTDRGEIPFGNTLNKVQVWESGRPLPSDSFRNFSTVSRHFKEAIGLRVDAKNSHVYISDLGGNIYRCGLDGSQKVRLHSDDYRAFTGMAIL